jgi:hypothetical protein
MKVGNGLGLQIGTKLMDDFLPISEPIDFGQLHEAFKQAGWTYGTPPQSRIPCAAELQARVASLKQQVEGTEDRAMTGGFWVDASTVCIHRLIHEKLVLVQSWMKGTL